MQASFKKLDNGNWGICCAADNIPPGSAVDVTKANGDVKRVVVAAYVGAVSVYVGAKAYGHLYSITETRKAGAYRPRGYARKSSGEQASLASQTKAYDLAERIGDLQWTPRADQRSKGMQRLAELASVADLPVYDMCVIPSAQSFDDLLSKPTRLSPDSKLFA
jgi:hypothetical protein